MCLGVRFGVFIKNKKNSVLFGVLLLLVFVRFVVFTHVKDIKRLKNQLENYESLVEIKKTTTSHDMLKLVFKEWDIVSDDEAQNVKISCEFVLKDMQTQMTDLYKNLKRLNLQLDQFNFKIMGGEKVIVELVFQ
jgi:hypothetical protein